MMTHLTSSLPERVNGTTDALRAAKANGPGGTAVGERTPYNLRALRAAATSPSVIAKNSHCAFAFRTR